MKDIFGDSVITNNDLISKILKELNGMLYIPSFLTDVKYNELMYFLNNIKYDSMYTKTIKMYGYNYFYKLIDINKLSVIDPIPDDINIIKNTIGVNVNQLNIEVLGVNDGFTAILNKPFYLDGVFIYVCGSDILFTFKNNVNGNSYDLLVKENTLMALTLEFRNKYSYMVKPKRFIEFNNAKIKRMNKSYVMTYRNLDVDEYYFM